MVRSYAAFREGKQVSSGGGSIEQAAAAGSGADFVWLQLDDPSEQEIRDAAVAFELPELAVEDAHHKHQRPKVEEYQGSIFIVLRNADYDSKERKIVLGEIQIFLGARYAIVVRHGGDGEDLDQVRERVGRRTDLLQYGPSAIVYAVMDQVVDDYTPVVEELSADIERVETEVFTGDVHVAIRETTESIYRLKREVLEFHKATAPLAQPLQLVREGLVRDIPEGIRKYFRDVLDHLMRVSDQVESYRELLTSILEANIALVSVRQNDIVQKISGWAAIIAVPTLISGIYGMNFEHMPELDSYWGYPYALLLMFALAFGLYRLLKRVEWL